MTPANAERKILATCPNLAQKSKNYWQHWNYVSTKVDR